MEPIDLSIVGELRLDSVDHIAADIDELTGGFVWAIGKGLLGDLGDMNFDAIAGKKRSGGDLNFVYSLLQFLADNASIVSKAAYGIGSSNGISLGLVGNFLAVFYIRTYTMILLLIFTNSCVKLLTLTPLKAIYINVFRNFKSVFKKLIFHATPLLHPLNSIV